MSKLFQTSHVIIDSWSRNGLTLDGGVQSKRHFILHIYLTAFNKVHWIIQSCAKSQDMLRVVHYEKKKSYQSYSYIKQKGISKRERIYDALMHGHAIEMAMHICYRSQNQRWLQQFETFLNQKISAERIVERTVGYSVSAYIESILLNLWPLGISDEV
jgi:hypothetical protein